MFCTGECKKIENNKEVRCGLLYDIIMENVGPGGKKTHENVQRCAFILMMESLARQEHGQIRIQAAVEDLRNEEAINETRTGSIVATGLMGMMHAVNDDKEKFEKCFAMLRSALSKGEQKVVDIRNHRANKLKELGNV